MRNSPGKFSVAESESVRSENLVAESEIVRSLIQPLNFPGEFIHHLPARQKEQRTFSKKNGRMARRDSVKMPAPRGELC